MRTETDSPRAGRPTRRLRLSTRQQLALVTVAFTGLLGVWSVVVPLFEAPDERAHIDMVARRAEGRGWPDYNALRITLPATTECHKRMAATWACPRPEDPTLRVVERHGAADAPNKSSDLTYAQLGGDTPAPGRDMNQMLQHPTLYYEIEAKVIQAERALVPGEWSFAREVALMRLVSVLLMAPLPLLCWWTARRLGLGPATALTASLVPFVIPQLAHIGSVVNNDVLQITLGALVVALSAGVAAKGDRSWRTALLLGIACGAAMLTKSSSFVLPVVAVAAYVVAWLRADRSRLQLVSDGLRAVTVPVVAVAISGWWYVGNRIDHGSFVPSIASNAVNESMQPPRFRPSAGVFAEFVVDKLPSRFWGNFGTFSVRQSWPLILASCLVAVLLAVVGFLARPRDEDGTVDAGGGRRHGPYLVLLLPAAGLLALVIGRSWELYARSSGLMFMQGRYLFPGFVGLLVFVAMGARRLAGRHAAPAIVAWALVMHVDALRAVLPAYWDGADLAAQTRSLVAWSPWPGNLLAPGAVVAALSLLGLAATALLDGDRPDDRHDDAGPPAGRPGASDAGPASTPATSAGHRGRPVPAGAHRAAAARR